MGAERALDAERALGTVPVQNGTSRLALGRTGLTLAVETEASATRLIAERSDAIAAHLGISRAFVRGCYSKNRVYWVYLEERWMREAFGPLAPRHLAEQQAWVAGGRPHRRVLRQPMPRWQRLIARALDFMGHLTGAALVLIALFFGAVWLAHHAEWPGF